MSICKQCMKRKSEINWRNYPYIRPHLLWVDTKGVYHFYPDYEDITYCREEVFHDASSVHHNCGYVPSDIPVR